MSRLIHGPNGYSVIVDDGPDAHIATVFPSKGTAMRNHDEREIALRCLDLAVRAELQNVVLGASEMLDFVLGTESKTPRETINAALETAGVI